MDEIADLQRQLHRAQEQRDEANRHRNEQVQQRINMGDWYRSTTLVWMEDFKRVETERGAAIERGERLYHYAIMATSQWDIWQEGCILEQNETVKQRRRAEAAESKLDFVRACAISYEQQLKAAEEDAKAQRALVARLRSYVELYLHCCPYNKDLDWCNAFAAVLAEIKKEEAR